eukprot:363354-Chlamydomonas_euryale.AAC.10
MAHACLGIVRRGRSACGEPRTQPDRVCQRILRLTAQEGGPTDHEYCTGGDGAVPGLWVRLAQQARERGRKEGRRSCGPPARLRGAALQSRGASIKPAKRRFSKLVLVQSYETSVRRDCWWHESGIMM